MPRTRKQRSQSCTRRGKLTIELFFVLPILIISSLAVLQFGVALLVKQAVSHAATVGVREASRGADFNEVADAVNQILAAHNLQLGPRASMVLEDPDADMPTQQEGTFPCTPPVNPTVESGEVRVTVCLGLTASPIINPLKTFGVDFTGKSFTFSSQANKE